MRRVSCERIQLPHKKYGNLYSGDRYHDLMRIRSGTVSQ
jgi:hypothetical protein